MPTVKSNDYEYNKDKIYEWRENNKVKYVEINRKYRLKCDKWRKIKQTFLNILIDN
jgi:hypothetical protein